MRKLNLTDAEYEMIFHENAIFSCEAKIETEVSITENTICVVEKDLSPTTNCVCCYDLSMKVGPLENKSYRIVVCKDSEMGKYIDFIIDYSPTTKGDIKVVDQQNRPHDPPSIDPEIITEPAP